MRQERERKHKCGKWACSQQPSGCSEQGASPLTFLSGGDRVCLVCGEKRARLSGRSQEVGLALSMC